MAIVNSNLQMQLFKVQTIIFLSLLFTLGTVAYEYRSNYYNGNNGDEKNYDDHEYDHNDNEDGEKLQIEGTVRNVDESKLSQNKYDRAQMDYERSKFNSYWAQLNWGARAHSKWPSAEPTNSKYTNAKPNRVYERANAMSSLNMAYYEPLIGEPTRQVGDYDESRSINPDAEFIDPSKVSGQLANLKFMRMQKIKTTPNKYI